MCNPFVGHLRAIVDGIVDDPDELVRIGGQVTPAAREAWNDFVREHGGTLSSLMQAIGEQLADLRSADALPAGWAALVERSKAVGHDRYRRLRGPG